MCESNISMDPEVEWDGLPVFASRWKPMTGPRYWDGGPSLFIKGSQFHN